MYKNVVFDVYGTLVDVHTDERKLPLWEGMSNLLALYGVRLDANALKEAFFKLCDTQYALRKQSCDYPEGDMLLVFKQLFEQNGVRISQDEAVCLARIMRAFSTEYIRLYPDVIDTLAKLKDSGKRLYVLSNAQACFTAAELDMLGLTPLFDGIMLSSDYAVAKPSADFFGLLFERYGLDRDETIYVGNDAFCDVNGAQNAGIASVWLKSNHTPKDAVCQPPATYVIDDGDFSKIAELLLEK